MSSLSDLLARQAGDGETVEDWTRLPDCIPEESPVYAWRAWAGIEVAGGKRFIKSPWRPVIWSTTDTQTADVEDCAISAGTSIAPGRAHPLPHACTCGLRAVQSRGDAVMIEEIIRTHRQNPFDQLFYPAPRDDQRLVAVGRVAVWGQVVYQEPSRDDWVPCIRAQYMRVAGELTWTGGPA